MTLKIQYKNILKRRESRVQNFISLGNYSLTQDYPLLYKELDSVRLIAENNCCSSCLAIMYSSSQSQQAHQTPPTHSNHLLICFLKDSLDLPPDLWSKYCRCFIFTLPGTQTGEGLGKQDEEEKRGAIICLQSSEMKQNYSNIWHFSDSLSLLFVSQRGLEGLYQEKKAQPAFPSAFQSVFDCYSPKICDKKLIKQFLQSKLTQCDIWGLCSQIIICL